MVLIPLVMKAVLSPVGVYGIDNGINTRMHGAVGIGARVVAMDLPLACA